MGMLNRKWSGHCAGGAGMDKAKEYRIKNFAVEVKSARYRDFDGEITLSITHNGRQWNSINLSPEEARKVVTALSEAVGV